MDIDGVVGLSEETRRVSDDLRFRYRQVMETVGHAGETVPAEIHGMVRIADLMVSDAADLFRRAGLFRDAEEMALSRTSLSMMLHSWAGFDIDPSDPGVPAMTLDEIRAELERLLEAGADRQRVRDFQIMLAIVTATELADRRSGLQVELDGLMPGVPSWEYTTRRRRELEIGIGELLIEELGQQQQLLLLKSDFGCTVDWEYADRYQEIDIQIAYLEWQLARQQATTSLGSIEDLLGSIGDADLYDRMTFVEVVAGDLDAHPDALPVALLLLADMDESHQTAVMAAVAENGDLDGLLTAVGEFEKSLGPKHSSWGPVGDFVAGAWGATWGSVVGVWGLTLQGLYDRDGLQEHWSGVGASFQMLFESPGEFLYQMVDIETFRENPARWLGGIAPDVATLFLTGGSVTAAARSGQFGERLARLAGKLDNLTVRLGARMSELISGPALRRMLDRLADETGAIGNPVGRLPDLPVGVTATHLDEMAALVRGVADEIEGEVVAHGSRVSGTAHAGSDIDMAILVDEAQFDRLLDESFGTPNPGSAKERTMEHADLTGKIQSGEAGE
jgi:hypothetical protein